MGGVRKAAQALGMHHAAVGRQLKHLEAWFGMSLFSRANNRLTLTEAGERYHRTIAQAFADMERATRELNGVAHEGPLRVSCSTGVAIQWLTAEMPEFERSHPALQIQVRPSDRPADIRAYEADVNVHFYRDDDPQWRQADGLKIHELVRPSVLVFASPSLAQQLPPVCTPSDLAKLVLLHGPSDDAWRAWLNFQGVEVPRELPGIHCWHPHMAIAEAKLGRGVLLASRFLVKQDLERGDLVEIEVPGAIHAPYGAYAFVAREDRWSSPGVAALRHFLSRRMAQLEYATSPQTG